MKTREKRLLKIIDELMIFFVDSGCAHIDIRYRRDGEGVTVFVSADRDAVSDRHLKTLTDYLSVQAPEGVEEEYWQLAGESAMRDGSELALIRSMADDASVTVKDGVVEVRVFKRLSADSP